MTEEYPIVPEDMQKKFQKWFGDPVPAADVPFSAEVDHLFEDFVPTNVQFPAEAFYAYYKTTGGRKFDLEKLLELFGFGFGGAVTLGTIVSIFLIIYFNDLGWHINNWSNTIIVILLAMVIGFLSGLFLGSIYKLRDKYSYKDE